MKYYLLTHSVEHKEIGDFPQVQEYSEYYDTWGEHSYTKMPSSGGPIEFDIQLPKGKLFERAILTDLLSFSNIDHRFLIVSYQLNTLMSQFNLGEVQRFRLEVEAYEKIIEYYAIYPLTRYENDFVDWKNTVFRHTSQFGQGNFGTLKFDNIEDYRKVNSEFFKKKEGIEIESLQLHVDRIDVDLFQFFWPLNGFYVSASLKEAIEENGITGVRFKEAVGLRTPL